MSKEQTFVSEPRQIKFRAANKKELSLLMTKVVLQYRMIWVSKDRT